MLNLNEKVDLEINKPRKKLYPARPSTEIESEIAEIEAIQSGNSPILKLSVEEKETLLSWENELGEQLEKISAIKSDVVVFYPGYFLTEAGQKDFSKIFPEQVLPNTIEEIKVLLFKKTAELAKLDPKIIDEISSNSSQFAQNTLEKSIMDGLASDGSLNIAELNNAKSCGLVLSPDQGKEKLSKLLELKKSLKATIKVSNKENTDNDQAKTLIARMYLAKLNEILTKQYEVLLKIQKKQDAIGADSLSESEKYILSKIKGKKNPERTRAILDKFIFGSDQSKNENRDYHQITSEITAKLSAVLDEQADFSTMQKDAITEKGLNADKVLTANINAQQRKSWGERILNAYGLLSEVSDDNYVKTRSTPAEDNKWQFVTRKDRKTKAVNPTQKVVLDSEDSKEDLIRALIVTCGHEIEGHVMQHHNKAKIPLRLFKKLGGDRKEILAEGGAVYNENLLIKEILGYSRAVSTYYLLALEAKRRGGDFVDCLMMAYGVELSKIRSKYDLSKEDHQEKFQKEISKNLLALIPRIKRIFSGVALDDKSGYLPNTKDTVYLEQEILMEKLAEKGLTKLAYVGGMNLKNIATLMKLGLISLDDIEEPKFVTKQIWEEIKAQYQHSAIET